MFNNLSDKLDKALHTLKGHGRITEVNVAETLKEVRRALLNADVNFKIAKEFTKRVQTKALGQNVLTTLNPGQLMVKLVKDELANGCEQCGWKHHVEVCHIKSISDFSKDTVVSVINDRSNLKLLCPNCHWLFDH